MVYQVYSNDDPRMTFDLSMARSDWHLHTFCMEYNVEESFSENIQKTYTEIFAIGD